MVLACAVAMPAAAQGAAEARFVQATAGAETSDLLARAGGREVRVTRDYTTVPDGAVEFELTGVARTRDRLENSARYTVLAAGGGQLQVVEDGSASGGVARLRVINAAPELGAVDVNIDGRAIARELSFRETSSYESVEPGRYELAATRSGRGGGALVEDPDVALSAGEATTAVIVGSAGAPLDFLLLSDDSAVPGGPPATGGGGLTRDGRRAWLAPALAAQADPPRLARPAELAPPPDFERARPLQPIVAEPGRAGLRVERLDELAGGLRPAPPERISIRAAGVDAPIEPVSGTPTGVEVPRGDRAGWFESGPRPGEPGRAIVIGHRDSGTGPALFARAPALSRGASVTITDARGGVHRYRVAGSRTVAKRAFPARSVYRASRRPELVLITCGGPWQPGRGYRDNVIVYARAA